MEGFSLNDIQALSINRNDETSGSFRRRKELVGKLQLSKLFGNNMMRREHEEIYLWLKEV